MRILSRSRADETPTAVVPEPVAPRLSDEQLRAALDRRSARPRPYDGPDRRRPQA